MAIVAPFGFECFITVLASKIFLVSILLAIGTSFIPLGCFTGPTGTGPSGLRFYEQLRLVLTLQLLLVVVADVVENLRGACLGAIAECALKVGSVRQMLEVVLLQKRPIGRRLHLAAVQAHGLAPRLHNLEAVLDNVLEVVLLEHVRAPSIHRGDLFAAVWAQV